MAEILSPEQVRQRMKEMGLLAPNHVAVGVTASGRVLTVADRRQILDDLLAGEGVEPARELLKMAMATRRDQHGNEVPVLGTKERIDIWKELLSYRMPKLKAVQLEGKIDTNINITIVRYGDDGQIQAEPGVVPKPIVDVVSEVVADKEEKDG